MNAVVTGNVTRITPAIAVRLLESNDINRPLRDALVRTYAHEITAGNWQLNGETIKVSASGRLIDGQHRLRAVILANKPIDAIVVEGLDDASFHTVDTGMRRSAAQIVQLAGHANATILATSSRWIPVIEGEISYANARVTTQESLSIIDAHPLLHKYASRFTSKGIRVLIPGGACAVFTMAAEKYGEDIVDEFLDKFESGEGLKKSDPVYELRERLIASRSRVAKLQGPTIIALTIKAVRAYAAGRTIGVLRWSPAEEWPSL